jgi:hypothetical protein
MELLEYYYDEDDGKLTIRFSTDPHSDYYRLLILDYNDIEYYSSGIVEEEDLSDLDEDFILEIIYNHKEEKGYPEEQLL